MSTGDESTNRVVNRERILEELGEVEGDTDDESADASGTFDAERLLEGDSTESASSGDLDRRTVLRSAGAAGAVGALGVGGSGLVGSVAAQSQAPTARGSIRQVYLLEAQAGATVTLYDGSGTVVDQGTADNMGSYVFEDITPASGYQVSQTVDGTESPLSGSIEVLPVDYQPPGSLYDDQTLAKPSNVVSKDNYSYRRGFRYIETRDGTTLACQVLLPPESEFGSGPYPTLLLYDGYEPSVNFVGGDTIPREVVANFGYAVVGLNVRGSACSGGRFSLGELQQSLDGYDAVETLAAQDWSDAKWGPNGKGIGLVGASYSGFSQLYVAKEQPPSLSCIAPGAPIGEFYRDTVYPGGLKNATFATGWASRRDSAYDPGGSGGNVDTRISNGDTECEDNQRLSLQHDEMAEQMDENRYYDQLYDERGALDELDQINVPLFLVISWQDEQTGARAARLWEQLGDIPARFIGSNADHVLYGRPDVLRRINRYLYYYVREEIPPADQGQFNDYQTALDAYENEDPVTITWERGQSQRNIGLLSTQQQGPNYEAETKHADWPPTSELQNKEFYLQPDGTLGEEAPSATGVDATSYEQSTPFPTDQLLQRTNDDQIIWEPRPDGEFAAWVTGELQEDLVCLGSGFLELYLRSSATDTPLQVTLSEVRPDGDETYVQSGWLRASQRKENEQRNKPRRPWHTHRKADVEPLPDGQFERMRVELFPFGHVFRAGSKLRIAVETPGGVRTLWGLFAGFNGGAVNEIAHTASQPSKLVLPELTRTVDVPDALPDCGTLRQQPCRTAQAPDRGRLSGTVTSGSRPARAALEFVPQNGTTTGRTVDTDDAGGYDVSLEAGTYTVNVEGESTGKTVTIGSGDNKTLDLEGGVPQLPGQSRPPKDHDRDGRYEDITGTATSPGEAPGIADVVALFQHLDSPEVTNNPDAFAFSKPDATDPGSVGIADVVELFRQV
jgi:predicted acyl esterase